MLSPPSSKHHNYDTNEILLLSLRLPSFFLIQKNHFRIRKGRLFVFCRGHSSVLFVSSLWNCPISFSKDDERNEMGPEVLRKQGQTCYSRGPLGESERQKQWTGSKFFSINAVCVVFRWGIQNQKAFWISIAESWPTFIVLKIVISLSHK